MNDLPTPCGTALTARSIATRARLVAVAERLFAERSIEAVTLIEINKAAGQRNRNACRYHFGDKNGLLQAILDKHLPGISARRNAMLDRQQRSDGDLRQLVQALVLPLAEKLADPDGGKDFIRINAQLIVAQTLFYHNPSASKLNLQNTVRLEHALSTALAQYAFPAPILQQRLLLAAMLLVHSLADHSRVAEARPNNEAVHDVAIFVGNLEDSIMALLTAPLSANTHERLHAFEATAGK